jgi:hypothetical protein
VLLSPSRDIQVRMDFRGVVKGGAMPGKGPTHRS